MSIPQLQAGQFDWDGLKRTMTAEISELQLEGFPAHLMIHSTKSGLKVMFEAIETVRDDDQDVIMVVYKPTASQSSVADIRLYILND